MDVLYKEQSARLLTALTAFAHGRLSLQDLKRAQLAETTAFSLLHSRAKRQEQRLRLFERTKRLFNHSVEINRLLLRSSNLSKPRNTTADLSKITAHAQLLGRNRAPDSHFANSQWFLPPFPSPQMISFKEDE